MTPTYSKKLPDLEFNIEQSIKDFANFKASLHFIKITSARFYILADGNGTVQMIQ